MTEALIRVRPGVPRAQASSPVTFSAIRDQHPIVSSEWDDFFARLTTANYGLPSESDGWHKKLLWRSLVKQGWGMLDAELRGRLDVITGQLSNEADSKLNWLTDSFGDLVNNGAAWTDTYGWAPDGASTWVDSGFTFSGVGPQKATLTSAHFSLLVTDFDVGDGDNIVGRDTGTDRVRFNPGATTGTKLRIQFLSSQVNEIDYEGPWTGHWLVTRTGTTLRVYRDGVQIGTDIADITPDAFPGQVAFGKNSTTYHALKFVGCSFGMHVSAPQARRIRAFHQEMHTLASYIAAL